MYSYSYRWSAHAKYIILSHSCKKDTKNNIKTFKFQQGSTLADVMTIACFFILNIVLLGTLRRYYMYMNKAQTIEPLWEIYLTY